MEKKGQHMMGLPFVFIISLIVAGVIIVSSIFVIKGFTCRQEQVTISLFVSELREDIKQTIHKSIDSQVIFEGNLPKKGCSAIEQVCIAFPDEERSKQFKNDDLWFEISGWEDKQLFFYPREGLTDVEVSQAHDIGSKGIELEIEKNPVCVTNNGEIKFILKNQGNSILIKDAR